MSNQVVVLSEYRRLRWDGAVEAFLAVKQLSSASRRTYRLALDTVGHQIGSDTPLDEIRPEQLLGVFLSRWGDSTPNTWNTRLIAVRSFLSFCRARGWIDHDPLELVGRRRPPRDRTSKAIPVTALGTLWARRDVHLREKALWRLLYETAARATEVLNLNIEDMDFHLRQATIVGKGGHRELIFWASGAARVMSRYLHGRSRGPVFLTHRKPRLAPAMVDQALLRNRRQTVQTGHRRQMDTPPATALVAHPHGRKRYQHRSADGQKPSPGPPLARHLRTTRPRSGSPSHRHVRQPHTYIYPMTTHNSSDARRDINY